MGETHNKHYIKIPGHKIRVQRAFSKALPTQAFPPQIRERTFTDPGPQESEHGVHDDHSNQLLSVIKTAYDN